jgi:hypothetical protein
MHVKSEIVLNLIDGTISSDDRSFWEKHLRSCTECATEYRNWSALLERIKRPHLIAAPADVLAQAKKLFQTEKSMEKRPSLRQIVASIIFDSFAQPALVRVRAQAATYEKVALRQVVLQAEEFDIHLRFSLFEDHHDLLGQILPRDSHGFVSNANLYLRNNEERISSASANELGEFQFCDVPNGALSLQIDLPTVTIISTIDIRSRS